MTASATTVAKRLAPDEVGLLLFGSGLRFKVMSWIVQRDDVRFYADLYATETGHYSSSISKVCARLVKLGMIKLVPAPLGIGQSVSGRCTYYDRIDSPLWDVVRAAVSATAGHPRPPSDQAIAKARRKLMVIEQGLR